jgi:hypothetical protein
VSTLYSSIHITFDQNMPFAYQNTYQYFNVFNKIVMKNRPHTHSISMMTISPIETLNIPFHRRKK